MLNLTIKRLTLILMLASTLFAVPVALGAQETPAETATGPSGLMVLAFLLGVSGIIIVGGRWLIRDSFQPDDERNS